MKGLLKEVRFILNSIERTPYYYNNESTDTYLLVAKVEKVLDKMKDE